MKNIALISLLVLGSFFLRAQEAERVPEFLKKYEQAKDDSTKVNSLWWAAYHSAFSNPEQGVKYGRQAYDIAVRSKDERQKADVYNSMGLCFDSWGKADSAEYYYKKSIEILENLGLKCKASNARANIANLFRKKGDTTKALEIYLEITAIQEACEDQRYFCSIMQSIGACYNSIRDYDKSIYYFGKALEYAVIYNDSSAICNAHHGTANAYLGLNKLDSANYEYLQSVKCYQQIGNTYHEAYAYEGLSELYVAKENIDSALFYCNKALKVYEGIGSASDIVYINHLTAQHLIRGKRYSDAKKILLKTVPMAEEQKLHRYVQELTFHLSNTEAALGNYREAYNYRLRSDELLDSLNLKDEKVELARLAAQYETEKRDRQIELEQAQNQKIQVERNNQEQQKYFFMAGVLLLSLLALVLVNRYRHKQKSTKQLEEKNSLIQLEKERAEQSEKAKQQFLANMSHEIRTPVNAINGLSRLLLEKQHDKQTAEYLKAINHSGENLLVVLNDILDLSKLEADKMNVLIEPFNLREEVQSVIQVFAQRATEKKLSLEFSIDESVPEIVVGDASRLTQVLANLISNAIKFTDEGSVSLAVQKTDDVNVLFSVTDTGSGIPMDKQNEVFENFAQADNQHTREHSGTGLGLPIAKKLVEVMGGTMQLVSAVGSGSTFSFMLPIVANVEVKSKETIHLPITNQPLHIVVAEDNEYNYWVTEGTLRKYFPQATVYRALNGEDVLHLWEEDEYHLILMDIQMPVLDGIETTKRIREKDKTTPILGLTASVVREEIESCLHSGMNDYVMKPFEVSDFVTKIRSVLKIEDDSRDETTLNDSMQTNERNALFLELIPGKLASLKTSFENKDLTSSQRTLHSMRPQLLHNGFERYENDFIFIESTKLWNEELEVKLHAIVLAIEEKLKEYQSDAHS